MTISSDPESIPVIVPPNSPSLLSVEDGLREVALVVDAGPADVLQRVFGGMYLVPKIPRESGEPATNSVSVP